MKKVWSIDGHSDGDKIPKEMCSEVTQQVESFEKTRPWYPRLRIRTRFRTHFCYIELIEKDGSFSPLCRLRYFKNNGWSVAIYLWGCDRYLAVGSKAGDFFELDIAIASGIKSCESTHLR